MVAETRKPLFLVRNFRSYDRKNSPVFGERRFRLMPVDRFDVWIQGGSQNPGRIPVCGEHQILPGRIPPFSNNDATVYSSLSNTV